VPFGIEQYVRMACGMREIKGCAILTVNDHLDMREVFAGLDFERAEIHCMAGGAGPTAPRRRHDSLKMEQG
jgi:DNA adenine methylase